MRARQITIGAVAVVVLMAGSTIAGYRMGQNSLPVATTQPSHAYPLLSRRVFSENPKDPLINFVGLRQQFQKYFDDNQLRGSLYFEYLHTGTEVRVSGDEQQAAASLLKVPLAMELYKAAELNKIDLSQRITLRADWLDSAFGTLYQKGAGYSLTLEEAAKIMLRDSDNTASRAIADTIDGLIPPSEGVFTYLDASITQQPDLSVSIGARSYSSILKCLYFACYLNHDDSQRVLQYLTETSFDDRLMAGIDDPSVTVAHKIGVFQNKIQSDCGIIYLPSRPYIFCAMLHGENDSATNRHIAELSKKAYQYVKNQ